jgi:lipoprotein-anchoring transpeptidase ErfK/SrfK
MELFQRKKLVSLITSLTTLLVSCYAVTAVASAQINIKPTQELAILSAAKVVHRSPQSHSVQIRVLPALTPITAVPTTLPVLKARSSHGIKWLEVMLPGRPNSSTGWITAQNVTKTSTSWHIVISLEEREVNVYYSGRRVNSFQAVVGKPSTPTPSGQFFVEEVVQMLPGEPGGPFALALSARSDVLQEFEGGPGQIGIHGRDNLGGILGNAESHGCIRLSSSSIEWLETRINPGTPVTINQY